MKDESNIWEEKNLTEHQKNCERNQTQDQNDTIKETKKNVIENQCDDIGKINQWERKCPQCNNITYYKSKTAYNQANRLNRKCRTCSYNINIDFLNKTRQCPNCKKLVKYSVPSKCATAEKHNYFCPECFRNKRKWSRNSNDWIRNCSKCNDIIKYKTLKSYQYGVINKTMCRKCVASNFLFNPKACKYINDLNKQNGWNLQHAMNGGEFKITYGLFYYSVDGYDKDKNIVFEYDEHHHYDRNGKLKEKDIIRQNNIINHLQCKFYRYNEKKKLLYEVTSLTS